MRLNATVITLALLAPALVLSSTAAAQRPVVIAHRGASGYVPEHTLEAYAMAYAMDADYIEPDLVLTKDGTFICLHDIELEDTTDVEAKFPDRRRSDGHWYAADFTLDEIRTLEVHERLNNRFPNGNSSFDVPTFEEMIELIQGLNQVTGRNVGIYPELKQPRWHASQGLPMEEAVLDVLARYGLTGRDAPVFLQCFERNALKTIRFDLRSQIPLIMLVGGGRASETMLTPEGLKSIAQFANGIGPDKNWIERNPKIVEWSHDRGLVVHPYTFRADDFPQARYDTFEDELRKFIRDYGVDGFFTDHADKAAVIVEDIMSTRRGRRR